MSGSKSWWVSGRGRGSEVGSRGGAVIWWDGAVAVVGIAHDKTVLLVDWRRIVYVSCCLLSDLSPGGGGLESWREERARRWCMGLLDGSFHEIVCVKSICNL